MKTLATLTIGTVIVYNDMANVDLEFVVLDSYTDQFGNFVNMMNLETQTIEPFTAHTEIGKRWIVK